MELNETTQNVTVSAIDELCERYAEKKLAIDKLKAEIEFHKESLDECEAQILSFLEKSEKTSWRTPKGNFIVTTRMSVQTPKSPEDRKEFFSYLKQKGVFEDIITVHSQTLNAMFKQELDEALKQGNVQYRMPGIGEPMYSQTLSLRRS
jgi:hypothetical protein